MANFSVCLLLLTQGLENTVWRTCETPTVVAEPMEGEGKRREGGKGLMLLSKRQCEDE